MFKTAKKFIAISLTAASAALPSIAVTAEPTNPSDSAALIARVSSTPRQAYRGQMVVSYWTGTESKAEDVKVYFMPPNSYRFEFLAPSGAIDRVVMSDGSRQQVQIMQNNQVSGSYTVNNTSSLIDPEEEKNLLLANYRAISKESEKVLGRPTWTVELTPLTAGKPHQLMRIDQATNVILEMKRFMPEGQVGSLTRFIAFEPVKTLPETLFLASADVDTEKMTDVGYSGPTPVDPDTLAILPSKLYGGFALAGGDQFEVKGNSIKHLRYTDGLLPVSIFRTPLPVKAPVQGRPIIEWNRPLQFGSAGSSNIYQWKKDHAYYTLIGDVQQDFLQQIAVKLQ